MPTPKTTTTAGPAHRRYTIALCKGAALLDETQTLLRHWTPGEEIAHFVDRVQRDNVLAQATAYRTKDIVRRVFARRFLLPTDVPARRLKRLLDNRLSRRLFTEVLFLYATRADPLLHDFSAEVFWPACRRRRSTLTTGDVIAFIADATDRGWIERPWSPNVQVKIARGVLSTLRDVGFLRDQRRGHRELVPYHLSDECAAFLAYDLHEAGLTDSAMSENPDWRLFGLDKGGVLRRLDDLGENKGMLVQRAGSVVRITWKYQSVEDLLNGLA